MILRSSTKKEKRKRLSTPETDAPVLPRQQKQHVGLDAEEPTDTFQIPVDFRRRCFEVLDLPDGELEQCFEVRPACGG